MLSIFMLLRCYCSQVFSVDRARVYMYIETHAFISVFIYIENHAVIPVPTNLV